MPVITSWTQGAWVALDILLVALLIYQVLVMIRGTRAAPMLVGLVVVAVIFYLARIGELTTLNWVVSHVLPYLCSRSSSFFSRRSVTCSPISGAG